jgi:hypothetical protein
MPEARERLRQAPALAGHLARPGTAACLPSHELTPFDQLLDFKLSIEHYYELPTFQRRVWRGGGREHRNGNRSAPALRAFSASWAQASLDLRAG